MKKTLCISIATIWSATLFAAPHDLRNTSIRSTVATAAREGGIGSGGGGVWVGPHFSYRCSAKIEYADKLVLKDDLWISPSQSDSFVLSNGSGFVKAGDFSVQASVAKSETGEYRTTLDLGIYANEAYPLNKPGSAIGAHATTSITFDSFQKDMRVEARLPVFIGSSTGIENSLSSKTVGIVCNLEQLNP